ncbi:hypothetical protein F8M41_020301 [Gigaspora margarita]|uniref:Uncharacterized protein n=1 Tax=Gigaspora margarita TaxID=4874 RepID=A0A8H4AIM7_GIGMA|nr:hypothetical protein F8M41_020301 [Gigaspora margarita]
MVDYRLIFVIFIINYFTITEADSSISIYPLQNVQAGSTVSIRWTLDGTQNSPFELGVTNTKTSADTILDNDVDLTKESEPWMVSVVGGSYKLFLRNLDNPADTCYSTVFAVSTQNAQSPNTVQSEETSTTTNIKPTIIAVIVIAAVIIIIVMIGKFWMEVVWIMELIFQIKLNVV